MIKMAPMHNMKNGTIKPNASNFLYTISSNDNTDTNSTDSSPSPSSPPLSTSTDPPKSQCSSLSDGESFEGYGEVDLANSTQISNLQQNNDGNNNLNNSGGVQLELVPHILEASTPIHEDDLNILPRDSWTRMSLRRAPTSTNTEGFVNRRWGSMKHSGRRQLGSNALASQLYRSSSFNSSGRSSNCDTNEEMYSDVSLENVQDLSYKVELLQRQITDLADTQNISEDRTTRTKTEYAVLQTRYQMLEEQYREAEIRFEERLAEEQKRHRELLARVEREAALQNENCQIKIKSIESEANALRDEAQRLRIVCDKQANDLHRTEEKLELTRDQVAALQHDLDEAKQRERKYQQDKKTTEELMIEFSKEIERLRAETGPAMPTTSPEAIRLEELHQELENIRQKNRVLEEQNEELQAAVLTRGVEEGRHLLNGTLNSLAQELEEMDQAQDSVDSATLASLSQLQKAFQDKEDENARLRNYIDTILLNIVENYPQLLEVKSLPPQPHKHY